ncbi:PREDICTED: 2-aminoethanethiol dioxygenase-like [Populus euphratica]|uniref:cysteine dioxygenase n=1 Tax=Populus euphratica TaxID=75702 RepID=A0AAJ6TL70_POPEU|nr:PREDICTED: 2-aminoethanethiol dioxygenase-like [Populus euphratica]
MGIETSVANKKVKQVCELAKDKIPIPNSKLNPKTNTNSKGKRGRRRRHHKKMVAVSPVQKLFNTCNEVFDSCSTGIIPSSDNIQKLKAVLDNFKPADVGLFPEMPHFQASVAGRTPVIRYLHLHGCDKFSMGIFCLPPSGVIPLHNHPGMTVFSKLLFGTMHIKSYDWVADVPATKQAEVRLAKVKVNSKLTAPCSTSILYPTDGGNMHCFTAVTACAVLDVLGPPYSVPDGRHCQYYLDFPFANFSVNGVSIPEEEKEGYAWLQEREEPEDLTFVGELYEGPAIVEK